MPLPIISFKRIFCWELSLLLSLPNNNEIENLQQESYFHYFPHGRKWARENDWDRRTGYMRILGSATKVLRGHHLRQLQKTARLQTLACVPAPGVHLVLEPAQMGSGSRVQGPPLCLLELGHTVGWTVNSPSSQCPFIPNVQNCEPGFYFIF